jgi:hypothetical protein
MKRIVIGENSKLAQALKKIYVNEEISFVGRKTTSPLIESPSSENLDQFILSLGTSPVEIFNAIGILDPEASKEDSFRINFQFPKALIEAVEKSDHRLVTFGTIMENYPDYSLTNPYLESKLELFNYIKSQGTHLQRTYHMQIHTWYGTGKPHEFMFLGQILHALRTNTEFRMSSGNQLREYHHIYDDLEFTRNYLLDPTASVMQVSHGMPLELRKVAEVIFKHFDKLDLLRIGSLGVAPDANLVSLKTGPTRAGFLKFREPIEGLLSYFDEIYL